MARKGTKAGVEADGAPDPLVTMARGLAEIVTEHGLSELIVDTKEITMTVRRGGVASAMPMPMMAMPPRSIAPKSSCSGSVRRASPSRS